ncbi:MAG: polyphosphate kinase [Pseudonocardiales bacterium]|jgi:hypothetical protein|nr:polyphosphate kinase [Pseudonocardiales bacterium]
MRTDERARVNPRGIPPTALTCARTTPTTTRCPSAPTARMSTWREDYPHEERLSRTEYDRTKRPLQIEPLELQNRVKETGQAMRSCRISLQDATPDSAPTSVAGDDSEVAR